MTDISSFCGIVMSMDEDGECFDCIPTVLVSCDGMRARLSIEQGDVLEGYMAHGKLRIAQAWIVIHKDWLYNNWDRVRTGTVALPMA